MPQRHSVGGRIRTQRLDKGIRQADLARMAGISPSYLNLIEHDRRRIGGKLLNDLARALDADPTALTDGVEAELVEGLRAAANARPEAQAEIGRVEEFAGRFGGWAALLAQQAGRITELEDRVMVLTDRLAHDPQLSASLHDVLSVVTSIRSTASILAGSDGLDTDWQKRFHGNLYEDAQRLAESRRSLFGFLDLPVGGEEPARTPREEADALLEALDYAVPGLEEGAEPEAMLAALDPAPSPAAQEILWRRLSRLSHIAARLPLARLREIGPAGGFDPVAIAEATGLSVGEVLWRLAFLPTDPDLPVTGAMVCDRAGIVSFRKDIAGTGLFGAGAPCPLWPVYDALTRPGRPVRAVAELPDPGAPRLLCTAIAEPLGPPGYGREPLYEAIMLLRLDVPGGVATDVELGKSCRICPRRGCPARREPSLID